jgi:hypothetical protein
MQISIVCVIGIAVIQSAAALKKICIQRAQEQSQDDP